MRFRNVLLPFAAASLVLAGCSSVAERATDRAVEAGIERLSDEDIDVGIDRESGSFSVEGEDGAFELGGGSLVEGFPDLLPIPDGAEVVTSMRQAEGGEEGWYAQFQTGATSVAELGSFYRDALEDAGFEIVNEAQTGDQMVTYGAERADIGVDVGILGNEDESMLTLRYYRIGE